MTGNSKRHLPPIPHPDHLRKQAKARLAAMRAKLPSTKLADAQLTIAREYGFANWAALQSEVAQRVQSPRGQWRRVQRLHLAALRPGWWREPEVADEEVDAAAAFFRAAVVVQLGFILLLAAGLMLLLWLPRASGFPWQMPIYINL